MSGLDGIFSALLAAYDGADTIHPERTAALVAFQVSLGVDGLYVGGSSGEAMAHTREERARTLKLVADANEGRLELIAHVGTVATGDALRLAECAAAKGYSAIAAVTPYYYPFSRAEVMAHYRTIADSAALPLIVYNFPAVAAGFSLDELVELLSHDNIIGVKHTSSDMFALERLAKACPDAHFYNGYDEMCLAGLTSGARGAIGTTYNFMGDLFVALRDHLCRGEVEEAQALQSLANDIIAVLISCGVMPGSKAILGLMGVDTGPSRKPFRTPTKADRERLHRAIEPLLEWRARSPRPAPAAVVR